MVGDLSQFHFIRPLWLLAIPVLVILWFLIKRSYASTHWEAHIDQRMLQAMRVGGGRQSKTWRWALLLAWIIASVAAAGPSWQQNTVPTLQNQNAMIIVLDLSASMLAQDLSPDRLTQAKYKLIDILRARKDGQTGLIAYAGDAHTVSPLTDDPNAIEILLPALHPSIMPLSGSNTESAIQLAQQLLNDSGIASGQILLITDGIHESAHAPILAQLDRAYALSVLSVGGTEATPIPVNGGGFLRDSSGQIVLTAPDNQALSGLAQAAGGRFSSMRLDGSDIEYLINDDFDAMQNSAQTESSTVFDSWADMGHWLVLLLLPIAALCFRKGVIYVLPLFLLAPIDSTNALEWQDLWRTPDQQAQQLLDENPQAAAQKFERQDWAGVANYQAKNYADAAQQFATREDPQGHYNAGNALALNGDLDGAIEAYQKALEQNPEHEDAQFNKQLVEQLKQQQEQQEQQNQESSDQNSDSQDQSEQSQSENSDESDQSQSDSEQQEQENQSESTEPSDDGEPSENEEPSASEEPSANQEPSADQEQQENEGEEESQAEAESEPSDQEAPEGDQQTVEYLAEETPDQLEDSSERWLRTINDDPSGLLRRKFQYQSWLRSREQSTSQANNNSSEERY